VPTLPRRRGGGGDAAAAAAAAAAPPLDLGRKSPGRPPWRGARRSRGRRRGGDVCTHATTSSAVMRAGRRGESQHYLIFFRGGGTDLWLCFAHAPTAHGRRLFFTTRGVSASGAICRERWRGGEIQGVLMCARSKLINTTWNPRFSKKTSHAQPGS
jgi:hypothetical protein